MVFLLGGWILITAGLAWLFWHCLSVGRVGSYGGDATRSRDPVRFWTSISVLGIVLTGMVCLAGFAAWQALA
jgi:hypothetical protein